MLQRAVFGEPTLTQPQLEVLPGGTIVGPLAGAIRIGGMTTTEVALGRPAPDAIAIAYAHFDAVGWLVNIVIGIALWMSPFTRERFPATQGRYPTKIVYACFSFLNGGLALRRIAEPWYQLGGNSPVVTALSALFAIAQRVAIALSVIVAWQRVRGPSHPGAR